ncbi:MAG TPA: protein kinase [Myxococcaceae bacterium]|nr:protein kinase [Myxococcaceae bacterium]
MSEARIGGRYVLERQIGAGAMGAIWLALDPQLQRRVALKLLPPRLINSAEARRQFEHEAKAVAQIQNPHVVQIHDYGVDGGAPYIVMELLAGEDLAARLRRHGRLAPAAAAQLLNQIARGLSAAHAAGIVHRDLKPANLFLARQEAAEVVKVVDFGLARLDLGGKAPEGDEALVGTLRYMSPEQMRGQAVDHRSDLFSLGVVLYQAVTGRNPFPDEAVPDLMDWVPGAPPLRPGGVGGELGAKLDAFFTRALELDPAKRFQSALELASAFAAAVEITRPARPEQILVVDDEPDIVPLMKQLFRKQIKEGVYELVYATDGEDALEKLRQHPDIAVAMVDINMPRMDGLTFLGRVGEVRPLLKVIVVTAYSDMSNIRVAMNRGAFDFLGKPINFQDLETTLAKTVKQAAEIRRMLGSVEENQLLRMFVHSGIVERLVPLVRGPDVAGGEREEATVAFLDVKDFTPVTRRELPDAVIRRLNANFDVITPELTSRGGMVDKFVGDAVMAVFRGSGHLERALDACLAARQQMQDMTARSGEQSPYAHGVCAGVDSGDLVYGSIGARALGRLDYTVLGDVVNTAARLASLADREQILIRAELSARLSGAFECRAAEGKSLPLPATPGAVHHVVCRHPPA